MIYQLPPAAQLIDRIRDLCGANLAAELLPVVESEEDGLSIRGWIGKAGLSRSTRQQQLIFLNGRAVENTTLNYALREGYHTALMKGQHPVTFLFIDMDPAAVDVNVHPVEARGAFSRLGLRARPGLPGDPAHAGERARRVVADVSPELAGAAGRYRAAAHPGGRADRAAARLGFAAAAVGDGTAESD